MQLSQLVTSLETSQRLKELGVKQSSLFYWGKYDCFHQGVSEIDEKYSINYGKNGYDEYSAFITDGSAFTSSELGEMLKHPQYKIASNYSSDEDDWTAYMCKWKPKGPKDYFAVCSADTEAEARGKLYIYLKENNLI